MRSKNFFLFLISALFLISCNIPSRNSLIQQSRTDKTTDVLWDFSRFSAQGSGFDRSISNYPNKENTTATPQLIKAVNFDEAFSQSNNISNTSQSISVKNGKNNTEWLFFFPADYASDPLETLYAAFRNTGELPWTADYYLEFFAGSNPSNIAKVPLGTDVHPGEEALFQIPVTTRDANWKACWQMNDPNGESFYEFCYNHGNGINTNAASSQSAQNTNESNSGSDVFWAFVRTNGTAPQRYSSEEQSAEFVSSSPAGGHTFQAYDHYEQLAVSFRNNGTVTWDPSYALVFYSGYNWMHSNSFSLSTSVNPGETATITMPMEIFEDNDTWFTCWYLASPEGNNLADFCFDYYTRS